MSYSDQGVYSIAMWPFSIKLLWAPLVDRFFIQKIGRRKTCVIGCQFVSGLIMICLANYVNKLIDSNEENKKNNIYILTLIFGVLVFLCATQDTALDAWSLDLLMELVITRNFLKYIVRFFLLFLEEMLIIKHYVTQWEWV